jgi:hypothetical protein
MNSNKKIGVVFAATAAAMASAAIAIPEVASNLSRYSEENVFGSAISEGTKVALTPTVVRPCW